MPKKVSQWNNYYFSDRIKRHLVPISYHPLTILEAPSGFGKTTAIREYIKEQLTSGANEHWYTCLGESPSMVWRGICELFSNINPKVANDLKKLNMPSIDNLFYMTRYLREIECTQKTYLIIDNYHLFSCEIPHELISVFSMHGNPKLHMIFITQQLKAKQKFYIHNNNIHTIDASSLFFDREGTASLFRMEGINLTVHETEEIFTSTEGWIAAIRLQMINFIETGSFEITADIEQLVEKAIWNSLTSEEKDFLLSLSLLDSFTMRQAAIISGQAILVEPLEELLKNNDFIRFLPDKCVYNMHGILQDYLRNRFYNQMSEDYQNQKFHRAGLSLAAIGEYYPASEFFYKSKNFKAILALPFSLEYLDKQKGKYHWRFIVTIVNECPEEILLKYPLTTVIFGYYMYMNGELEAYQKLCKLLKGFVQSSKDFTPDKIRRIEGEYLFLASLGEFNDLSKMLEIQKQAWTILGKPTELIEVNKPWLFATPTVLGTFWRESGQLENILLQMEKGKPLYRKLSGGHGAGGYYVMQAEAMLMRGNEDECEILCHKALYEASSHQQISMCIRGELLLARLAILRGDTTGYFNAVKGIENHARENSDLHIFHMAEYCMSLLGLVLGIKEYVAPWFYDMSSIKKILYAPVIPFAQTIHLKLLLMEKRYNEFYAICPLVMDTAGNIKYILPRVYCLIFWAIATYKNGDLLKAQAYLKEALVIALPDKIYLPFSQEPGILDSLLEFLKNSEADKDGMNTLLELAKRQEKGMKIIRKAVIADQSPLTPREREIAQLARDRLSAKEIAERLYISETTVRTILRNVYSKLNIHSKTELATKSF